MIDMTFPFHARHRRPYPNGHKKIRRVPPLRAGNSYLITFLTAAPVRGICVFSKTEYIIPQFSAHFKPFRQKYDNFSLRFNTCIKAPDMLKYCQN